MDISQDFHGKKPNGSVIVAHADVILPWALVGCAWLFAKLDVGQRGAAVAASSLAPLAYDKGWSVLPATSSPDFPESWW